MTKSDQIRKHFRNHPNARVLEVVEKFKASKPMVYKLHKEVRAAEQPDTDKERAEKYFPDLVDVRGQDYGKFRDNAALTQGIKRLLADHAARHNKMFADDQWEALEMIVTKIARIVNGNPEVVDHWADIAGYATLVADRLQGNAR